MNQENFEKIVEIRGVLQKFCVAEPFSSCDNTISPKLTAYVTEGISSAQVKFCRNRLKIM